MVTNFKKTILSIGFIFLSSLSVIASEIPEIEWSIELLKPGIAKSVAVDVCGNSYITGHTSGDLEGSNTGGLDVFIAKYNPRGEQEWLRQFGTVNDDGGNYITVDERGNCYVCGSSSGDFDGENAGKNDAFIVKYSTSGNQIWRRQLGTPEDDIGKKIILNDSGLCYLLGSSTGNFGFTKDDLYAAFAALYDTSGNQLWIKQPHAESKTYQNIKDATVDNDGNIYLTGEPGFLAKCDSSGSMVWEIGFQTTFKTPWGIELDQSGIIHVTGWTASYVAVTQKYNNNGDRIWSRTFIKNGWSCPKVVVSYQDSSGDVLIGGCQGGPPGTHCDGFICKYTSTGDRLWIVENNIDYCGNCVAVDQLGNNYLAGGKSGDAFLIKIKSTEATSTSTPCACVKKYSLDQNYPNPFNPTTAIQYSLTKSSAVELNIYNINGEKIRTLIRDFKSAGQFTEIWDSTDDFGRPVSSGVYFYELITNTGKIQKKLLLLR